MTVLNEHIDGIYNLVLKAASHCEKCRNLHFIVVSLLLFTFLAAFTVQPVQTEHAISQKVCQILRQKFCMVEHSEKLMEVFTNHDEIQRRLEFKSDQSTFKTVYVGEYGFLKLLVKFFQRSTHEPYFFGAVRIKIERVFGAFEHGTHIQLHLLRNIVRFNYFLLIDKEESDWSVFNKLFQLFPVIHLCFAV